jgi:hypothetical protein
VLLSLNLDEDFVDKKRITVTLVSTPKSHRILRAELDAPQSNGFVADRNSALRQEIFNIASTQIKAVIEPEREACPWGTTYWII